MKLLGFNYSKISIEKYKEIIKDLKINSNIDVLSIDKMDSDLFKGKEEVLAVKFSFIVDYSPDIAKIELHGTVLLSIESKIAKDALKQWKEKKIPENIKLAVFNTILRKANIKSLELGEEMGLPPHINLPQVKPEDKK